MVSLALPATKRILSRATIRTPEVHAVGFDFTPGQIKKPDGKEATRSQNEQTTAKGEARTIDRGPGTNTAQRAFITASAIREAENPDFSRSDRGRGNRLVKEQRSPT